MHSEKRRGKVVKNDRNKTGLRKSIYSLDVLFEKLYNAKQAEGLAKGTMERYERVYRLFGEYLDLIEIKHDIREIDVDVCRGFVTWLLDERQRFDGHKYKPESAKRIGVSPRYTNDCIKTLRTFFKFLVEEGLADENPFEKVNTVKQTEDPIDVLTEYELKALLKTPDQRKYADFRDYVVMNVLLDSMARINEVLSLTIADVDLTSYTIRIRSNVAKNRKGRVVPIQKRTVRIIKDLISEVAEFESEYIFLANYGERLTTNNFRKRLTEYAKDAGISKHVHPHLFRHTAATMFLEAGGDIRHLQMLLGHSDLRMVMRYTHLSDHSLAKQHEQFSPLNRVLNAQNKPRKILK